MTRSIALLGTALLCAWCLVQGLAPPSVSSRASATVAGARRVIIFPPILQGYTTIDEGCSHIVGASNSNGDDAATHDPLFVANPCLANIPLMATRSPGTTVPSDPEQVLLRSPDVVFVFKGTAGALEAAGLPVATVRSLAAAPESWGFLGMTAGKSARAEEIQRFTEAEDAGVVRTVEQFASTKPTFLLMWNLNDPNIFILGPPLYSPTRDLASLRTINLAPRYHVGRVEFEQLLSTDPDVIFLRHQSPQLFYRQPMFSALKASRERRVYRIPSFGERAERLVPDHPAFLRWAAELLYPQQMPGGARSELRRVYERFFSTRLDDAALDRALLVEENGASSNYQRFRSASDQSP